MRIAAREQRHDMPPLRGHHQLLAISQKSVEDRRCFLGHIGRDRETGGEDWSWRGREEGARPPTGPQAGIALRDEGALEEERLGGCSGD